MKTILRMIFISEPANIGFMKFKEIVTGFKNTESCGSGLNENILNDIASTYIELEDNYTHTGNLFNKGIK